MSGKPKRNPWGLPQAINPEWFRVEPKAVAENGATSADVYVYDAIDPWWGLDPQQFVQAIDSLDVDQINLYVNSPGGSVYGAQAMTAALDRSTATITAYVDGLAASAASFLITAADEVVMAPGAEIMIHDALTITWGNAAEHEKSTNQLNRLSDTIAGQYAAKAGGDPAEWRQIMQGEQWYSAQEAVDAGLADRIAGADDEEQDVENLFDLSVYAYAGRSHAPNPAMPRRAPAQRPSAFSRIAAALTSPSRAHKRPAEPDGPITHENKEVERMPDIKKVTDRLGLSAEATEDDIVNAIDGLEKPTTPAKLPEGVVAVDKAQFEALKADAAEGREARKEQIANRRDDVVNMAVTDGKIPAGRRDHYRNLLDLDEEGTTEVLNKLESNTIPLVAKGNGGSVDDSTDEDAVYNKFFPKSADTAKGA
jgi:ATP-dependent protease ClpP protease subunit